MLQDHRLRQHRAWRGQRYRLVSSDLLASWPAIRARIGEPMTYSPIWSKSIACVALLFALAGCKKDRGTASSSQFTSLLFDASSPAAREALATPVSYRLTEANYNQWERAQSFLDALPRSAFVSASGSQGNAIDRAVQTLEASPRARTAIERTGLTVRDFVLETIALAQAAEARSGQAPSAVTVPPENIQFVQRYESRIMLARSQARQPARVDNYSDGDTTNVGVQSSSDVAPQIDRNENVHATDTASAPERARPISASGNDAQPTEQPKLPTDTARDTIPR